MRDFAAGACDFHSNYASDFRDFPGDFPGDFSSDFGGAPRTAKQPPVATETAPPERGGNYMYTHVNFLGHSRRQGHRGIRTAASWQRKR